VSSKTKFGGRAVPKKPEASKAEDAAQPVVKAPEAVEYGKGGVFRSVGGGKRVRVTG
jgi:hypothetical protein